MIYTFMSPKEILKDGPSAGIIMQRRRVSVVLSKDIKANLAMTGEITLAGKALKIGGLKEKLIVAKRSGITNVLIPKENLVTLTNRLTF